MFKLQFKRPRRSESAPQFTQWQRKAAEQPTPPGPLPYAAYDEMERDSMVQTALTVKRLGVMAAPYRIVPGDDSDDALRRAKAAERQLQRLEGSPHTILVAAMDSFAKGWSVQELVWEEADGEVRLATVRAKDPSQFGLVLDAYGGIQGLTLQMPPEPERALPRGKFVIHRNRASYGRPKGTSDLDAAFAHYSAKQALLKAWRHHLERFASPTVYGKVPAGVADNQQQNLLEALNRLDRHAAITFPAEVEVGLLGDKHQGSEGFLTAIEFHNREIARSILGQTLTTDEGGRTGSLALGKVHLQVMLLQFQALRRELADTVMSEQVLRPMDLLNYGPGPSPRFEFEESELALFTQGNLND